ncbi:hypothetical protein LV84_02284 [Algoriphagus ratkowskyi]|uniref:Lipocalin-like protein n=1 Tax=Algoriphagus ratkowskyi TaxID=57028 RepID=A0A2W7SYM2_9BACT|nr:hypothetical protein [Algoriphagus ratkowskyi]PZX55922.1 hypothetical protein LV84_02284 [Algoriphagus ratkowskyi]TXD77259.1 hypothetical protein ESW18_13280 [Algoriphagus ratkowskyi]
MYFQNFKIRLRIIITVLSVFVALASCKETYQEELQVALEKNLNLHSEITKAEDEVKKYKQLLIECQSVQTKEIEKTITENTKPKVDQGVSKNPEIGIWKTPAIYGGGNVRIFKKGNDYFKTESYPDGTSFTHRMSMTKQGENRVFKSLEKVSSDTWVVNQSNKLSIVDKVGLVYSVD